MVTTKLPLYIYIILRETIIMPCKFKIFHRGTKDYLRHSFHLFQKSSPLYSETKKASRTRCVGAAPHIAPLGPGLPGGEWPLMSVCP